MESTARVFHDWWVSFGSLDKAQWQTLTLEIQKEAITMFNGLDKLAAREKNREKNAA